MGLSIVSRASAMTDAISSIWNCRFRPKGYRSLCPRNSTRKSRRSGTYPTPWLLTITGSLNAGSTPWMANPFSLRLLPCVDSSNPSVHRLRHPRPEMIPAAPVLISTLLVAQARGPARTQSSGPRQRRLAGHRRLRGPRLGFLCLHRTLAPANTPTRGRQP